MEFAPNNRVLSGELIIFQNEMLEIFKEMMDKSTHPLTAEAPGNLKPRFVTSIILEFLRTLLENSIPQ